jgi:F-type H+-transporting ATPase subunit epsilon
MNLKILLPFRVFAERSNVSRIVVETLEGSFGLLPRRLDCVLALAPGILTYVCGNEDANANDGEVYLAVGSGVLVKAGPEVLVSVRRAVMGKDLHQLRDSVEQDLTDLDERDQNVRSVMEKLEAGFLHRLAGFHHV